MEINRGSTTQEFFAVVAPGLEDLALWEFSEKWRLLSARLPEIFAPEAPEPLVSPGGLTFHSSPGAAWILNHCLKIPTRILLRLCRFPARDFPKLFRVLTALPWQDYFRQGPVEPVVSSTGSRLAIKSRLEETVHQALAESQRHRPWRRALLEVPQKIYLRLNDNQVTVSVDTSGEPLYRRGYRLHVGRASLRETLAAALWAMFLRASGAELKGWSVIDPMCGAGTLLIEALGFHTILNQRAFTYQNFPCRSRFLPPMALPRALRSPLVRSVWGSDNDEPVVLAARHNFSAALDAFADEASRMPVEVHNSDLFAQDLNLGEALRLAEAHRVILLNPPYGIRLPVRNLQETLTRQLQVAVERFQPVAMAVVLPGSYGLPPRVGPLTLHPVVIKTVNGGLPVHLALYQ